VCTWNSKILEFEKNVIEPKLKGSNFGKTWLKPIPKKTSNKFLNVRIGSRALSKKEESNNTSINKIVIFIMIKVAFILIMVALLLVSTKL